MEGAGVKFFKNRPEAKFGKYGMRSFAHASSLIVAIVLRRRPSLAIRCAWVDAFCGPNPAIINSLKNAPYAFKRALQR